MKDRLKYLRTIELNMRQKDFAERIGFKISSYSDLETGKSNLHDRHIIAICNAFNVNERWLRFGEEPIFNEDSELINMFKSLPSEDKKILKPIVTLLYEKHKP